MDFTLTEEQELLRETARGLLGRECPSTLVRAHWDDPSVIEPVWDRHLREWVALGDGPLVDHCLFLEEAGRVLLPGPYFATSALFLPLLRALSDPDADAVAAGELSGTVALAGRDGLWHAAPPAEPIRRFVPEADRVDRVAIVLPGPSVAVVPAPALTMRPMETLDSTRRLFELEVPPDLESVPVSTGTLTAVLERATIALAAEMVGTVRWLVDTSVSYSKQRVQFDRPIGSFQGLQFKMVDMSLDLERATAAVYYAAMAFDADDPDRHRAAHVAKAAAGAAARRAAKDAVQIHGGIGYTWECDVHLYLRRAYASEYLLGSSAWHHDRLADQLLA
jgi:alkylation response protein AidB-like acyl-CoA dehydrogenase